MAGTVQGTGDPLNEELNKLLRSGRPLSIGSATAVTSDVAERQRYLNQIEQTLVTSVSVGLQVAQVGLALTGAGAIASALISYAVKQLAIRVVVNLASNVAADLLTGKSLSNSLDSRLTGESLLFGVVQSPVQSVVSAASGVLAYHAAKALGGSENQARTAQFAAGLAAGLVTPGSFSKGGAAGKGPGATGSTAGTSGRGAQSGTRSASSGSGQAKAPSAPVKPPSPGAPAGGKPTPATAPNTPAPKPNTGPNGPQTATQGCPPGSKQCFVAGTPFLTPLGQMRVEDFQEGYEILTRDEFDPDGPVEVRKVDEVFSRMGPVLRVMVSGRLLKTTHEHPFYVVGIGWRPAIELQVGDQLSSHNESQGVVESVEDRGEIETVYNVSVSGYHTYFVGERGWGFSVWVHNTTVCLSGDEKYAAGYDRIFAPKSGEPVKPGQSGTYGDLKKQKKTNGETEPLDMDHRPSYASQKKALEDQLGRKLTDAEAKALKNDTPAVAAPRAEHQQNSRTYGGRNTPEQIAEDAKDLEKARRLDEEAMRKKP